MNTILEQAIRIVEIANKTAEKISDTATFLASLSHEERLDWLKEHRQRCPDGFEREIGGTVYTVNTHFSGNSTETVKKKVERFLKQ